MKVQKNAFVALDYSLSIDSGEVVDRSAPGSPLCFIFGTGHMFAGLEKRIEGMGEGDTATVTLEPEDAYGPSRPELYRDVPKSNFGDAEEVKPGDVFHAVGPHGRIPVSVRSVQDETVTIDLNHPLAGKRLTFEVRVQEVRDPTDEEVEALTASCGPAACAGCDGTCH